MMIYVPRTMGDTRKVLEVRLDRTAQQYATIQETIMRDMERGAFLDYGEYKRLFTLPDMEKGLNGQKLLLAPKFTKRAFFNCLPSLQDTRMRNAQATRARDIDYGQPPPWWGGGALARQKRGSGGLGKMFGRGRGVEDNEGEE